MRRLFTALLALALLPQVGGAQEAETTTPKQKPIKRPTAEKKQPQPRVQMAILLDTSGSMNGLINQARTQLWNIVNEFATTTRNGIRPKLELALYQYGSGRLSKEDGYIRQILPFTDNLDQVSEELFKLTTGGSREYCGMVIDRAANELKWSGSGNDLKIIYIAGNEHFTQGPVDYRKACRTAISRGVIVNTVHCGPRARGIAGKWADGAMLADGSFTSIDHNARTTIAAPQDKELIRLSAEVNKTYIPFGNAKNRSDSKKRQTLQDMNAAKVSSSAAATRAVTKGNFLYNNASWDLCDACKQGKVNLKDIKEEDLPENMRKMTHAQREAHVQAMQKKRGELQKRVAELGKAREKYVAAEMKKIETKGAKVLGQVIIESARAQAAKKGFLKKER